MRSALNVQPLGGDAPEESTRLEEARRLISIAREHIAKRERAEAAEALAGVDLPESAPLNLQLALAETYAQASKNEESDQLFESLLLRHYGSRKLHFLYGRRLHVRGFAMRSLALLNSSRPFPKGSSQLSFIKRVRRLCELLCALEGRQIGEMEDCRLLAMKHALAHYRHRTLVDLPGDRIGRLSLITGGLGAGGAERQLSRTAAALEVERRKRGEVGGIKIGRPIEVLVRSHSGERRDFYLSDLRDAQVDIAEIDPMPTHSINTFGIDDPDLVTLLDYLPIRVNFGVRRLVPHFHATQPDVVSLWQDGACLFASLAAIIAGVPRIQLMFRGLPPAIRKHMFQPEYEVLYRALAIIPGVQFVSNSRCAALAYSQWLDIPIDRFSIIYNGVERMNVCESDALDARWEEFVSRTPDASHVVGGVFRFDTDKRPTTWVRFAARHAKRHPDVRFVAVGGGRLFNDAVQLAKDLKVYDRILFVGHSSEVGYWMKKMDVLVLMSSFEGLPNVLIEAQYLGVPVVSTPAGGASECFIEGVTGHVLNCADKTDLDLASEKVSALIGRAHDAAIFGPATRDFLDPNFSVSRMLENFIRVTCAPVK
jgi:glycosyltransferase involved in cell wall biosynthesis